MTSNRACNLLHAVDVNIRIVWGFFYACAMFKGMDVVVDGDWIVVTGS